MSSSCMELRDLLTGCLYRVMDCDGNQSHRLRSRKFRRSKMFMRINSACFCNKLVDYEHCTCCSFSLCLPPFQTLEAPGCLSVRYDQSLWATLEVLPCLKTNITAKHSLKAKSRTAVWITAFSSCLETTKKSTNMVTPATFRIQKRVSQICG